MEYNGHESGGYSTAPGGQTLLLSTSSIYFLGTLTPWFQVQAEKK